VKSKNSTKCGTCRGQGQAKASIPWIKLLIVDVPCLEPSDSKQERVNSSIRFLAGVVRRHPHTIGRFPGLVPRDAPTL